MNTKLIESLVEIIHSLSEEEQALLEEKLFFDPAYLSSFEVLDQPTILSGKTILPNFESDLKLIWNE
jgi:hypothetical protein